MIEQFWRLTEDGDPDGVAGVGRHLPAGGASVSVLPRVRPARQVCPVVVQAGLQLDDADRHVAALGGGVRIHVGDGGGKASGMLMGRARSWRCGSSREG